MIIETDVIEYNGDDYHRYYLEDGTSTQYFVNRTGEVLSTKRKSIVAMTPAIKRGYYQLQLRVGDITDYATIHKMVIRTFTGDKPDPSYHVDHIDGNKLNNDISNLEWVSPSENVRRAHRNGLCNPRKGDSHHNCKYSDILLTRALSLMQGGYSISQVSNILGIPKLYLQNTISGNHRKHILDNLEFDEPSMWWLYDHPEYRKNR